MPKKLAFTICSINYLAQAKVLAKSFQKYNTDYEFAIGLCDKLEGRDLDKTKIEDLNLLEVDKIGIEGFSDMCDRYDITELNTAVKPFYLDYFFKSKPDLEIIYYIDPDIEVFDSFSGIEDNLASNSIILTPHFYTPIFDNFSRTEQEMFVNGIYNLGFLAVKRSPEVESFINWWKRKLETEGYMDIKKGMFVDQLYCNMVPLYFENVFIEKNPGYNIAYWNLHERTLSEKDGKYFSNGQPLIFFHFSGMDQKDKLNISRWQNRFDLENRKDLVPIFDSYRSQIEVFENAYFRKFECFYANKKDLKPKKSLFKKILTSVTYRAYAFFDRLPI